jgi:flagellar basal-body rod protein FlgG
MSAPVVAIVLANPLLGVDMLGKYVFSLLLGVVFLADSHMLFAQITMDLDKAYLLLSTSDSINHAMDVTFHNIANFKTSGFKKQRVHFQDGKIADTPRIWQQGRSLTTNIPLDLLVSGEGFFQIRQPNGEVAYTRNGSMHLNGDGNIVTFNGDMLDPQICIPSDQIGITIRPDGTVEVQQSGNSQRQQVGRIELAHFPNPSGLKAVGPTLFEETPESGQPVVTTPGENGAGKILQGFLEDSNVEIMEELTHLRILQSWKQGVDQAMMTIQERQR